MDFRHAITIDSVDLFPIRAKGGVSPNMALGIMPTRPALILRITDSDGCLGWGEVWANFPPRANIHKAHVVEDVVAPKLRGASFTEPREIQDRLRDALSTYFLHVGQSQVFEHILAGIDIALWDLALRRADLSFAAFMGVSGLRAPSYASSINMSDLERLIPFHAGLGQRHFKLKIGFLKDWDRKLIERGAALCPEGARIMVDSNQAWTLDQAKEALLSLQCFDPFFAEEPLRADADLADWENLARTTDIPLAAGENFYGLERFLAIAGTGVKVLQPDVAKWGGVTGALDLAAALPQGAMLWPHFMGTAVGQMAALSVTAAVGDGSVCELDVNENHLRTELCGNAITIQDGAVEIPTSAGLVVPPAASQLARFREIQ